MCILLYTLYIDLFLKLGYKMLALIIILSAPYGGQIVFTQNSVLLPSAWFIGLSDDTQADLRPLYRVYTFQLLDLSVDNFDKDMHLETQYYYDYRVN